jgi:hypothetical protein
MPGDERGRARRGTERRIETEAMDAPKEAQATLLGRFEAMLRVLGRDDALRRSYVRRRWQGLARQSE